MRSTDSRSEHDEHEVMAVPEIATDMPIAAQPAAEPRCPHLVFHEVLGADAVARLLEHVAAREADFRPAVIRSRRTGRHSVETNRRDCLTSGDLGPFRSPIESFIRRIAPSALARLRLNEPRHEPCEFSICAYGEGGHFAPHIDTAETTSFVRIVSCIYYFAATPRRFSGGELRLHGFPTSSSRGATAPHVDVAPETDTLVLFPSWMTHEVLPVRVPSGAWTDWRFTINCWIHRAGPNDGQSGA
jgi:Rps23 Pro-64 3,4-dihydroxylase Tpa1-like proline 4-hydroxylase